MNIFIQCLRINYHLIRFIGLYIELFCSIITGHHYSLANLADGDFLLGNSSSGKSFII
jgi:hypothetical protein